MFGGLPNARMENFAPGTGVSPKMPKKSGGKFSRAKREFGEKRDQSPDYKNIESPLGGGHKFARQRRIFESE